MLPTLFLTGDAVTGLIVNDAHRRAVEQLPAEVKLGRKALRTRPLTLRLENYLREKATGVSPPANVDWYTKAAASIARMYRNDVKGCCVISGKAHALGVWSGNDPDSGPVVLAMDNEIDNQYIGVCGPGDNGCYIPDVLDYMVSKGFIANGQRYKIKGYCSFDWTSKELTQTAIQLGGAISIGFNIPGAWMNSSVWDVTGSGFVGGHDVTPCGYGKPVVINTTKEGVVVASWGRLYLFTWEAWLSKKYIDEAYFMVPDFLWTGTDKQAPSGVNLDALLKDMAIIKGGGVPPLPDPNPTPPVPPDPGPTPPPAPKPQVVTLPPRQLTTVIHGPFGGTQRGVTTDPGGTFPVTDAAPAHGTAIGDGHWLRVLRELLRQGLPVFCAIAPTLPIPPAFQIWVKLLCAVKPPAQLAELPCDCEE
jgi:hypothetical protein